MPEIAVYRVYKYQISITDVKYYRGICQQEYGVQNSFKLFCIIFRAEKGVGIPNLWNKIYENNGNVQSRLIYHFYSWKSLMDGGCPVVIFLSNVAKLLIIKERGKYIEKLPQNQNRKKTL